MCRAVLCAIFLSISVSSASDPKAPEWADFATFKDIKEVQLDPAGERIACTVAMSDLDADRYRSELWVMPYTEGDAQRLELETDAISKILWSPKADWIAVVGSVRTPPEQAGTYLWVVNPVTGKSKRLTRIERSNHYLAHQGASLCWSPDSAHLAYLATDADAKPAKPGPIVIDRIQYKTRTALSDNRKTHIWTIAVATGETRQITGGTYDQHSIDWSPRGEEIVFCSNRQPDPDAQLNYDLYTVRVNGGAIRQLTKTAGSEMTPVFSPDGRSIAYTMTKRPMTTIDSVAEDDHVWLLDRESGEARELTAKLDRRCSQVRWSCEGKALYFLARDHGKNLIYRCDHTTGESARLFDTLTVVSNYALARTSARAACVLSSAKSPSEIETFNSDGSERTRRTRFNGDFKTKLAGASEVNFKSVDGTSIQGWLFPPPLEQGKKVPLILAVHGGPHSMHSHQYSPTFQYLAAHGFAVLLLNPRGSSGYGQKFSDGSVNDWGGADYRDLMAGVDHALAEYPYLDANRLGVMGGSYGGYMAMWMITQTDRFKAAVPYAGLSNLISFYATSLYQDLIHVEFAGQPWDRYEPLWERSPLRHIKRARTATLILHGEADNDVHITQSEEFYTALKQRGVETVFVRYPDEGHGATQPSFQKDQIERTVAWFKKHLRDGKK